MLEGNRSDRQLTERGVIDILNETFAIYWRHFPKIFVLTAIIHVPLGILELAVTTVFRNDMLPTAVMTVLDGTFSTFVYAAIISAVGQHYLVNEVKTEDCYIRALWRVRSLAIFALALASLLTALVTTLVILSAPAIAVEAQEAVEPELTAGMLIALAALLASVPILVMFSIYLVVIMPAIVVERRRVASSLQRAFDLTRNSRVRICGHVVVYSLVSLGLIMLLSMPMIVLDGLVSGGESPPLWWLLVGVAANRGMSMLIVPVSFIAATLLYYDLRVRKENYDMSRLSLEMGIARG